MFSSAHNANTCAITAIISSLQPALQAAEGSDTSQLCRAARKRQNTNSIVGRQMLQVTLPPQTETTQGREHCHQSVCTKKNTRVTFTRLV